MSWSPADAPISSINVVLSAKTNRRYSYSRKAIVLDCKSIAAGMFDNSLSTYVSWLSCYKYDKWSIDLREIGFLLFVETDWDGKSGYDREKDLASTKHVDSRKVLPIGILRHIVWGDAKIRSLKRKLSNHARDLNLVMSNHKLSCQKIWV